MPRAMFTTQAMKFYNSVSSSTRGQARRMQSLISSPKSPVNIVRSDAEKGWERVARTYALETYAINWSEYWPFLDAYINLSSHDGLRLLEYYLQQRVLHSQILKTTDQLERFSSQYLALAKESVSNENDPVLTCVSQLIQNFYTLVDLLNLNDLVLNRHYRQHLESSGFQNPQNQELINVKTSVIHHLQWLSRENKNVLPLFTRPLLNSLTMVFTLLVSPSGCALIDQIQQNQCELRRHHHHQRMQPASRLSLIGLICPQRRRQTVLHSHVSGHAIRRSHSWPNLPGSVCGPEFRRCHSQVELNQNNNHCSSSTLLNETNTSRNSISDLTQRSMSISNSSMMFASQTSVDMLREDRAKVDKWHYFLAG